MTTEAEKAAAEHARDVEAFSGENEANCIADFLAGVTWARENPGWISVGDRLAKEGRVVEELGKCQFTLELQKLINRYSLERESDTPDFILADYLRCCLITFNRFTKERERVKKQPEGE